MQPTNPDSNISQKDAQQTHSQESTPQGQSTNTANKHSKLIIIVVVVALLLLVLGGAAYALIGRDGPAETAETAHVDDGHGHSEGDDHSEEVATTASEVVCGEGQTEFSNSLFGVKFCHPSEWGFGSVMDAKVGAGDTGYRETIRFSGTNKFVVGGMSEDWSTEVGRGVGCQEPTRSILEPSSVNPEWHNEEYYEDELMFAQRSLSSPTAGYDLTENVGNPLVTGVCVQGHKVINGSRYKVVSVAYSADFNEIVTNPAQHLERPTILFTSTEREQLTSLIESIESY
jgi:hypothetical protein